jgi:hypothetical protein
VKIKLQNKTQVEKGIIKSYWFENENIGLANTLFHRITLPLKEFDSGLDYEEQSVQTEIVLDWYNLGLPEPSELDGLNLSHSNYSDAEGSVYVGCSHNPLSPPSDPVQRRLQSPPAKSNFLAVSCCGSKISG